MAFFDPLTDRFELTSLHRICDFMGKTFRHQHQRPKKNLLVVGREKVIEAMQEGTALDRIYLQATVHGPIVDEIKRLATMHMVPISKVPVEKLNSFNVFNHEGCVALKSKISYLDLQEVTSFVVEQGQVPLFLILDGITDVRNIGAIARSAYCMGAQAIIIPDKGVGALNEDAILTSAGALEKLSICRVNSLHKAIDDLHLNGIRVYATVMNGPLAIADVNWSEPAAFILGGEEKGVQASLIKQCDGEIRIPMTGDFDSLNVSVSAGIVLYEAMKQRS